MSRDKLKWPKNETETEPKEPKMTETDKRHAKTSWDGPKWKLNWSKTVSNESRQTKSNQSDAKRAKKTQNNLKWSKADLNNPKWANPNQDEQKRPKKRPKMI